MNQKTAKLLRRAAREGASKLNLDPRRLFVDDALAADPYAADRMRTHDAGHLFAEFRQGCGGSRAADTRNCACVVHKARLQSRAADIDSKNVHRLAIIIEGPKDKF